MADKLASKVVARFEAMKPLGTVGVDSGTLLVIDPCYLDMWGSGEHPDLSDEGWHAALDEGRQQLNFANGAKAAVIIKGFGGDGGYPVLVEGRPEGQNVGSFAVDFMPKEAHTMASKVAAKWVKRFEYKVIGHERGRPCASCKQAAFCVDCDFCESCGYTTGKTAAGPVVEGNEPRIWVNVWDDSPPNAVIEVDFNHYRHKFDEYTAPFPLDTSWRVAFLRWLKANIEHAGYVVHASEPRTDRRDWEAPMGSDKNTMVPPTLKQAHIEKVFIVEHPKWPGLYPMAAWNQEDHSAFLKTILDLLHSLGPWMGIGLNISCES